ncbi:MAG: insulinase family protein, partial [Magnetococcales bacterium]|nr:insulinase family protein [Magnetococcales bacterium]
MFTQTTWSASSCAGSALRPACPCRPRWLLGVALLLLPFWFGVWPGVSPLLAAESHPFRAQEFVTAHGVRVYLVENHRNPMVEMRLWFRAGSAYDPPGKEGLANITAWLFNEGAGDMDADAFHEHLDYFGIHLNADTTRDALTISLTTLTSYLDEACAALGQALLRPRFDPDALARAVADRKAKLIKEKEKASIQAGHLLNALIFANHPYGHPTHGTLEGIDRITLEDVRRFRADGLHSPELVVAVAGDIDQPKLRELLERPLSGLDAQPSPWPALPQAVAAPVGRMEHRHLDVTQSSIRLGRVAINRHDPDYYPLTVLDHILGGGSTSRLFQQIRDKKGLSYGVSSTFSPLAASGPMVVALDTKNTSVPEALALARAEMTRLADADVDEAELADAIANLTGTFALHLDGLDKLASTWATIGFYRRGSDYLEKWPERIRAVTREDVRRVAKRFL